MKALRAITATSLLLAAAPPSHAAFYTGSQILNQDRSFRLGYVAGLLDASFMMSPDGSHYSACINRADLRLGTIADAFEAKLKSEAWLLTMEASLGFWFVLTDICGRPQPPAQGGQKK